MKFLCLIPARKNSKRLKNKNFQKIRGEMLIEKTLKLASSINKFDNILLSSDNLNILKVLKKYPKIKFLRRPSKLAKDQTKMKDVIQHAINYSKKQGKDFNAVVLLQPTSPLRKKSTILRSIKKFKKLKPDFLTSIKVLKHNEIPKMSFKLMNIKKIKKLNIHIKKYNNDWYCLDGGTIFIFKVPGTFSMLGKGAFIKVEFPENIDIDTKEDLLLVKKFYK